MDSLKHTSRTVSPEAETLPKGLLLVVFIHGFKGTDSTFAGFPDRLRHILSETITNAAVETIVFPAYETKGNLNVAVIRFADWLTDLTVRREVANGMGGGAGKAKIVLCGHSMGGLLAADSLIDFVDTRPDKMAPLWPNIIACLAFDTPYYGLHPHVFKNSVTQATGYVNTARSLFSSIGAKPTPQPSATKAVVTPAQATSSRWQKWAPAAYAVGGALLAGVAAGTALYKREEIGVGYTWITDHMKYVGNLWDEGELRRRVERLGEIEEQMGVVFRTFYTFIPPNPPSYPDARTFIILPKAPSLAVHFVQNQNTLALDEIQAHTGMFDSKTNDGYYDLGLMTAQMVRDALINCHKADDIPNDNSPIPAQYPAEQPMDSSDEVSELTQGSEQTEAKPP
ncbi:hypothetical protein A0H81_03690 [Grifola frondosa]|uniref:Uncharacterized protein n=1 Tax=Grifola frondosa TaxID=5627 RepID=A0A1C7MP63_GRIFR|nr:hypothetical protein A0H81_03690 [Grifola frondosa]